MQDIQKISQAAIKKTLTYRYYIFTVVALAYFLIYFHRTSTAVMAPELVSAFGITPTAVGFLGSLYFYAYALGQLPAGILADRWGARKTLSLFTIIAGIGAVIFGRANGFDTVLVGRFMVGLGAGFVFVPITRIITDWFKKDEFAVYVGLLSSIGNVGSIASAAPMVFLMTAIGWRNAMSSIGVASFLIAILIYSFVRNKPSEIGGASMAEIENTEPVSITPLPIVNSVKILFSNYNYWTIFAMFFVLYGTIMGFQGLWGGPYLMNVYHLTNAQAGKLLMMIPIGMIPGCILAGFLADKVIKSRKKVAMAMIACYIVVWLPLVFWIDGMSINFLRILLLAFGFFGGSFALMSANMQESLDVRMTGTGIGVMNFFGFSGGAAYQQIMAGIISKAAVTNNMIAVSGFKNAFIFCLVTLIFALAFYSTQREMTVRKC